MPDLRRLPVNVDVIQRRLPDHDRRLAVEIEAIAKRNEWDPIYWHDQECRARGCYSGWPDPCKFPEAVSHAT